MARKPKLPGAADFFRADDEPASDRPSSQPAAEPEAASARKGGAEATGGSSAVRPASARSSSADPLADLQRRLTGGGIGPLHMPPPARSLPQPPTEKITFYIPSQMLQQLEVCRVRLLTEHGLKVNRSQIVQAALAMTVHDSSLLAEALLQLSELWADYASDSPQS